MNDTFSEALLSSASGRIPDEFDWFAPLIGDWDCDYYDELINHQKRHVKGEWIFRRILEGTGVQDIFIFPSRSTKEANPQPDGDMAPPCACLTGISSATTWFIPVQAP